MSSEDFVPWGSLDLGSTWDEILARFVDGTFSSLGCLRTVRPGYCIFVVKVVLPAAMCTWSWVRLSQLMRTPTSNGALVLSWVERTMRMAALPVVWPNRLASCLR